MVTITSGKPQEDIISPTGKGNIGGVVAIPEVLGNVRLGCSVFEGNTHRGSFICPTAISGDVVGGTYQIQTGINAGENRTYTVIPWATDATSIDQYGAKYFGLMFCESFSGSIEHTTTGKPSFTMELECLNMETYKQEGRLVFKLTVTNPKTSSVTIATISNFKLIKGANTEISSKYFSVLDAPLEVRKGESVETEVYCNDPGVINAVFASVHITASSPQFGNSAKSNSVILGDLSNPDYSEDI